MRYAVLWSGGKDSALAFQRARSAGLEVTRLITFYEAATDRVRFHATRIEMIQAQAAAIGVELALIGTSWPAMEQRLVEELDRLRSEGFSGIVLGDIHLTDVRAWYEAQVVAAGLEHTEPIWGEPSIDLLTEFVQTGGRAVITCVDLSRLSADWLGRVVDERFVTDIATTGVDPCGENGEYHPFAFAGPLFHRALNWQRGEEHRETDFLQVDIRQA
ncbi:MAG TPA: diphthine--ammonia ligase [Candidatus Dormibacteraeota bacterium]